MTLRTHGVRRDSKWDVDAHETTILLRLGKASASLDVEAWCRTLVRVQGVFELPGRSECLVVLSYIGRPHGCEEVEIVVPLLE